MCPSTDAIRRTCPHLPQPGAGLLGRWAVQSAYLRGSCLSLGFGSQGRDLKLCLWDLAEGRNAVVDSVCLESVGFCRSSVLAGGQQHWMLAVPGRGSNEVSPARAVPCSLGSRLRGPQAGPRSGLLGGTLLVSQEERPGMGSLLSGPEATGALGERLPRQVLEDWGAAHVEDAPGRPAGGGGRDTEVLVGLGARAEGRAALWGQKQVPSERPRAGLGCGGNHSTEGQKRAGQPEDGAPGVEDVMESQGTIRCSLAQSSQRWRVSGQWWAWTVGSILLGQKRPSHQGEQSPGLGADGQGRGAVERRAGPPALGELKGNGSSGL